MQRSIRFRSFVAPSILTVLTIAGCTNQSNNAAYYGPNQYGQGQYGNQYPAGQFRPNQAPNGQYPQGTLPQVHPLPAYNRPVNISALQSLLALAKPCAPQEVAPGTWAAPDCNFRKMTRAIPLALFGTRTSSSLVGGTGATGGTTGPVPASVDLRSLNIDGPIKNQGAVGACTAFSLSTAMDVAVRKMGRQDTISPLHVWSEYGVGDMGVAGDQVVNDSITTENLWPYDPAKACELTRDPTDSCGAAYGVSAGSAALNPSLQAEKKNADASGHYKVSSVEEFDSTFDSDQMAAVLAGGDPIWIAMSVDMNAWKSATKNGGVIPDYTSNGSDGHAVVLEGYRQSGSGRQFLVHNSWGTSWGANGYGWLSDVTIKHQGRAAYKVHVVDSSGVGPLQIPGAQPQASGCASGQVRDAVLGTCVNVCASGSAPAAGVCLPSVPGFAIPGQQPQGQSSCPQGQGTDPMTRQCVNLCANGTPPIGGLCIPIPMH